MPRNELFIGNLNRDVGQRDLERAFDKYGRVVRCSLKDKGHGIVYAFLEFEDERDAADALKNEHGKDMCGSSMVVELAKGKDRRDGGRDGGGRDGYGRYGYGGRGGGGGRDGGRSLECYNCGERGHFARDCRRERRDGRGGGRDRSRDRYGGSGRRDRSRDRSRDRPARGGGGDRVERTRRHASRSPSNHSRTKSRSRSPSYDNSKSSKSRKVASHSRSRSRSAARATSRGSSSGRNGKSDAGLNHEETIEMN